MNDYDYKEDQKRLTHLRTVKEAEVTAKNGKLRRGFVQYQVANTVASTIWLKAETKKLPQKNPKMFIPENER